MPESILSLLPQLGKTLLASALSIAVLFIITKLLGNKQISELNMFDYINGITIGSIAAEMATDDSALHIASDVVAILMYGAAGVLISFLTLKSIKCRHFFSGREIILIANGKVYPDSIKRAKLDINDLLTKARISGYYDIADIAWAILENNGEISFLPKSCSAPVVRKDILPVTKPAAGASPPIYIIIDGNVLDRNLSVSGRDETWLSRELKAQGARSASEVFLAYIDQSGSLVLHKKASGEPNQDIFS